MSDPLECPDCQGSGISKDSLPGLNFSCLLCRGQGMVGGEYGEPAEEPPPPALVDPMNATPAWEEPGWGMSGCPTCAGAKQILTLGGAVRGGEATKGGWIPCPTCVQPKSA